MNHRRATLAAAILVSSLCLSRTASATDPVVLAPANYKVIFENDKVRVLEASDKPGEKVEMHSHPDTLMYVLAPFQRKLTLENGRQVTVTMKPGDTRWMPAQSHAGENIGTTETRALFIEFKPQPATGTAAPKG